MITERPLIDLARLLKRRAETWGPRPIYPRIDGVKITHPYFYIYACPYDAQISTFEYECFRTLEEIFSPKNLPSHWRAFIKEVGRLRKEQSCDYPVDLLFGVYLLLNDHPETKKMGIPQFAELPNGDPDLRDKETIIRIINAVLANEKLRQKLKHTLAYLIPDVSSGSFREPVLELIELLNIRQGIIIDFGCGTGESTVEWAKKTKARLIGIERQHHPRWYDPYWRNRANGITFLRGDIMKGVPLRDNCADLILMEAVAPHVTIAGLKQALAEVTRVLKEKTGVFVVGPQTYGEWYFFTKERNRRGNLVLVRKTSP